MLHRRVVKNFNKDVFLKLNEFFRTAVFAKTSKPNGYL